MPPGRFREGGQQGAARDLGLNRLPLGGNGRPEIARVSSWP